MSALRVIKKYPNRRLYDTVASCYITLDDIRRLVVEQVDFVVHDQKSGLDITHPVLLQVIADQSHPAMLTNDFLKQVIRDQQHLESA
ncbi:MAG: hypothetical protein LBE59_02635 [Nevskiaceae bacterium]|jgi:polyhydroxyalkanoate synthesis repressor PhaR|nr:hypothetical protein [Nevskiaceae bacterium]